MQKGYYLDNQIDALYTLPYEDTIEQVLRSKQNNDQDIKRYRLKSIFSGEMLESEGYPIWSTSQKDAKEQVKKKTGTSAAQRNLNLKNIRKRIVRLTNANFTDQDIWVTNGYRDGVQPTEQAQAVRDVQNYLRRMKRAMKKQGIELKYLYVVEQSSTGRFHNHIIMNCPDRDLAEKMWKYGKYSQARRLQPDDFGLEGMSRYIAKDATNRKGCGNYGYSRNLEKSWHKAKTADSKMTKSKARKLALEIENPKIYYEKLYPGYEFLDLEVRSSEFVSGCYLYARLRKKQDDPGKKKRKRC